MGEPQDPTYTCCWYCPDIPLSLDRDPRSGTLDAASDLEGQILHHLGHPRFVSIAKFAGVVYYSNMVFQEVYQWTPIQTALGFLIHSLFSVLVFTVIGRILPRLPLNPLILTGFLLRCITAIMFSFVTEHTSYFALPFPAFIIHIFGMVFSLLPIQITAVRDAENKGQGLVGALFTTGLQLSAPFGIALLNMISLSSIENIGSETVRGGPVLMKGFRHAFYAIAAMGLFALVLALVILPWDKLVCPSCW